MMHKKVKVWGKETTCNMCEYIEVFDHKDLCCRKTGRVIKGKDYEQVEELFNQCPFKIPLEREAIEKLGFTYIQGEEESYADIYEGIFSPLFDLVELHHVPIFNNVTLRIPLNKTTKKGIKFKGYYTIFKGTVYNSMELKFILKSIGVLK